MANLLICKSNIAQCKMESGKDGIATLMTVAEELESESLLSFVKFADILLSVILRNKYRQQKAQSMMARRGRQSMTSLTRSERESIHS